MPARQHLRSVSMAALNVPVARHSTMGDRSFCVAAARVWNSLPSVVTSAPSLLVFRRLLKTELYCHSFPDNQHVILWCSSELWLWLCLTLLGVLVVFLTLRHLNLFVYNNNNNNNKSAVVDVAQHASRWMNRKWKLSHLFP